MKVILQKDVSNLGDAGDVINVANGYARNYLLPNNLVLPFNEASKKAMEHQSHLIKVKKDKRKKVSEKIADAFSGLDIKIKAKTGEDEKLFGSVTALDIAKELKKAGYEVDKRKIQLEEPIKTLGNFEVPVKLGEGITANVKVAVEKE